MNWLTSISSADLLDLSKFFDGLLLAAGVASIWLMGVLAMSIARALGATGGAGFMWIGKFLYGRHRYIRGNANDIVNVTLNTTQGDRLSIDTIVSDKPLIDVWPNNYHVFRLKAAAKTCQSSGNPIVKFTDGKNGNGHSHIDEYRATYDPLISLVAENCTNNNSIDLSLGVPMVEHRFILALTYETHCAIRSQHFRVMMINEKELANFPQTLAQFSREEHKSRFETLKAIAAEYKLHPHRFGVVNIWRPREPQP